LIARNSHHIPKPAKRSQARRRVWVKVSDVEDVDVTASGPVAACRFEIKTWAEAFENGAMVFAIGDNLVKCRAEQVGFDAEVSRPAAPQAVFIDERFTDIEDDDLCGHGGL
jgi:hypothetical protein